MVVKTGLLFFYKNIKVVGKENLPKGKPILITPNHQNALIDALLIEGYVPGQMRKNHVCSYKVWSIFNKIHELVSSQFKYVARI